VSDELDLSGYDLLYCKDCGASNWRMWVHSERYWDVTAATTSGVFTGEWQPAATDAYGILACKECYYEDEDVLYHLPDFFEPNRICLLL